MFESVIAAVQPADSPNTPEASRRFFRLTTVIILAFLTLAVVILRLYRLDELPAGIQVSEALNGVDALRVLNGEHAVFFPSEFSGHEGLVVYLIALSISLLDQTDLALRLPTALANAGTVFVVFWLGRLLFGRDESGAATSWRGMFIGGVAASLMAVSIGQTVLGRTVFRANHLLLLTSLCLALLWWGWRERSWWAVTLAGVCAGLVQYTYIPARFTPFLFLALGLSFLIARRNTGPINLRSELPWILNFGGTALLVAAPIFVFFALHPEHFFLRSNAISVLQPHVSEGNPLGVFLDNLVWHLAAFGFKGDVSWRHNFDALPMLNPWEASFFWLGAGISLWRWQRPACRLLLLYLAFLLLPAVIARDYAPNTLRMLGATPAVYLITAYGLWEAFHFVRRRLFPTRVAESAVALGAVAAAAVLVQGVTTFRSYFGAWAFERGVQFAYEVPWSDFARTLNALPSSEGELYLIPNSLDHPSFDYIYRGAASTYYFPRETADLGLLASEIESAIAGMENLTKVKVVQLNNVHVGWIGNDTGRVPVLLGKYARLEDVEHFNDFQVHNFTEISMEHGWTFFERMQPLTVEYDGGISLMGLALGQGPEEYSAETPIELRREEPLWIALNWETRPDLEVDFSVSIRLHDREGEVVFQEDSLLWNPLHRPTSDWTQSEGIDSLFQISLPPDLAPGEYELRLVVYDSETLTPTVQVGVWEPELTLAEVRTWESD
ncbi:MAG: hypothetical protein F4Y42_12535 [Caldilineaceae bacterium SB0664_bin_27]|uniref:Glycosyltransferase RgtA/B/C/D-like domain-containing protein n=1 Tax=Caldilineaceae bacterium SB0664_bin_27 TaxID=2605260 RepID=A0A6B0YWY2_9CHLR|nr:hypothetical protein [Caldilineaceae bacterium SB0664_bin_27]